MAYKAFLSYSHTADAELASALQSGLHQFARPWYRLRAIRVFRDDTNLSISPGLWTSIERALSESEYFLLLASPQAAASKWVCKELDYWVQHRTLQNLLIIQTGGELCWDDAARDFDWERTSALPKRLAKVFSEEPLHRDLRKLKTSANLSLSNSLFKDKIADLASPLHGRPKDELIGEDVRHHRNFTLVKRVTIIVLLALTISLAGAAWFACRQRDAAVAARSSAITAQQLEADARRIAVDEERNAKSSLAKYLYAAADDEAVQHNDYLSALALACGAVGEAPANDPRLATYVSRVEQLIPASPASLTNLPDSPTLASFSPDLDWLFAVSSNGEARLWNLRSNESISLANNAQPVSSVRPRPPALSAESYNSVFTKDGSKVAALIAERNDPRRVDVLLRGWSTRDGTPLFEYPVGRFLFGTVGSGSLLRIETLSFSPDGRFILVSGAGTSGGYILRVWDTQKATTQRAPREINTDIPFPVRGGTAGHKAVIVVENEPVIVDLGSGGILERLKSSRTGRRLDTFLSQDGRWLALRTEVSKETQQLELIDTNSGQTSVETLGNFSIEDFSEDGNYVLITDMGKVFPLSMLQGPTLRVFVREKGQLGLPFGETGFLGMPLSFGLEAGQRGRFTSGARYAIAGVGGGLQIWDWKRSIGISKPFKVPADASSFRISASGTMFAAITTKGTAMKWNLMSDPAERILLSGCTDRSGSIVDAKFSPDGTHLLSITEDGFQREMAVWDLAQGRANWKKLIVSTPNKVQFSSDGSRVAVATSALAKDGKTSNSSLTVLDTRSGKQLMRSELLPVFIERLAFTSDGTGLAAAVSQKGVGSSLLLYDVNVGRLLSRFRARTGEAFWRFSRDGRFVLTSVGAGGWGGARDFIIRSTEDGSQVSETLHCKPTVLFALDLIFSQAQNVRVENRETVLIGFNSGAVFMLTPEGLSPEPNLPQTTFGLLASLQSHTTDGPVSPTGKWILTIDFGSVAKIWEFQTGIQLSMDLWHEARIVSMSFTEDSKVLLVATSNGVVRKWFVGSGEAASRTWLVKGGEALTGLRLDGRDFVRIPQTEIAVIWKQFVGDVQDAAARGDEEAAYVIANLKKAGRLPTSDP